MSDLENAGLRSVVPTDAVRREDRRSLLIVDDDEGPRAALSVLFREDYEILVACDGAAAVQLAREARIDTAILDIRMPGLSGIETLEAALPVERLSAASEIWVTSSTREVTPVTTLDGRAVGEGRPGPLWRRVDRLYQEDKAGLAAA